MNHNLGEMVDQKGKNTKEEARKVLFSLKEEHYKVYKIETKCGSNKRKSETTNRMLLNQLEV